MAEWKLVPVDPTPEMIAAAVGAVLPPPHPDDFELARSAARLILMDPRTPPGCTVEGLAAAMATIIPAHRAMLAAVPQVTVAGGWCVHCGCGNDEAAYAHSPLCPRGVAAVAPTEPACKFCGVDTKRPCVLANALECQNFGFYPDGKPARGVPGAPAPFTLSTPADSPLRAPGDQPKGGA